MSRSEVRVALFFPRLTVFSGGVERTLRVMEHGADANLRFTTFVDPDVIRDAEVRRRLEELRANDQIDIEPGGRGAHRSSDRFDAVLVPSEFWIPALRRAEQAGINGPAFLEFHQLPYIGTLDVLKCVGVDDPTTLDVTRFPFVSSRVLGDSFAFFTFQTAACYLNVRSIHRRGPAGVMAVTPVTAKNLEIFGYRESVFVPPVHVGVEPRRFENGEDSTEEPYEYDAVYVGRFHPHKGFLDLPEIAAHARKSLNPDVRIAVCGSAQFPRHERLFKERVSRFGVEKNLVMLRWLPQKELYRTIRRSRVLLYPSYVDAFSITVLESLCLGVPVVAYGIDALRMIWARRHGVFLSPVGDPRSLAQSFAQVAQRSAGSALRRTMRDQAKRLFQEYTWSEAARWERAFLDGDAPPRPTSAGPIQVAS